MMSEKAAGAAAGTGRCHLLVAPVDFRIAKARLLFSQHIFVQLESGGVCGAGEGVLYRATPYHVARLLQQTVLPWWECVCRAGSIPDWTEQVRRWADISPAAAYAVDTALWDWWGRMHGQALSTMLGGAGHSQVDVTEQIFIHDWSTAEAELSDILARGTRRLKLKIGLGITADLEMVRRVRAFVGPAVELRVDANHAYTLHESEGLYRQLADLGVLAFEEPLRLRDWAALRLLRQRLGVPVILDESILTRQDLCTAIAAQALDMLNIKLTRVGGLSLAREYIVLCRQHDLGVLVGCSEDLGLGTAAIVHLGASLAACHAVEGLGPLRLHFDVCTPSWQIHDGALRVPQGPGLGVALRQDWRAELPAAAYCFDLLEPSLRFRVFSHYARLRQRAENVRLRLTRRLTPCGSAHRS